jgi:hypothetical protein
MNLKDQQTLISNAITFEFRNKIDEFFSQKRPKTGGILGGRINECLQVLKSAY